MFMATKKSDFRFLIVCIWFVLRAPQQSFLPPGIQVLSVNLDHRQSDNQNSRTASLPNQVVSSRQFESFVFSAGTLFALIDPKRPDILVLAFLGT